MYRCSGKFSHRKIIPTPAVRVRVKIKDRVKFRVRVRVRSRVKIKVRIRARVEVRVRVRVSVSYIMTIWRWEEFFRCDKFPTTPDKMLHPAQKMFHKNEPPTWGDFVLKGGRLCPGKIFRFPTVQASTRFIYSGEMED